MHVSCTRALVVAACCAPALFITPRADAALVSAGLFAPADGLLTHDTETDLAWLDLTPTAGLSYNQVSADAGGWLTLGFRYATSAEVLALWTAAGMVSVNSSDDANIPAVDLLGSLMGTTPFFPGSPFTATSALIADPGSAGFRLIGRLVNTPTNGHFNAWNSIPADATHVDNGNPVHSYLVADYNDVPAPPTFLAVGASLALSPLRRRR